ncbi:hypothetical protein [Bombilactobacillus bombi]|nr:hypothetical protein [Bombilactobacillus bombi]
MDKIKKLNPYYTGSTFTETLTRLILSLSLGERKRLNEDQYYKQLEDNYYRSLEPRKEIDLDNYDEDLKGVTNG